MQRSFVSPSSSTYSSKSLGLICNFRFNPAIFQRSKTSIMWRRWWRKPSLSVMEGQVLHSLLKQQNSLPSPASSSFAATLIVCKNSVNGILSFTFFIEIQREMRSLIERGGTYFQIFLAAFGAGEEVKPQSERIPHTRSPTILTVSESSQGFFFPLRRAWAFADKILVRFGGS